MNSRLISSADDQEEDRQQPVVDPVQQRHAEARRRRTSRPSGVSQNARNPGPSGELTSATARIDVSEQQQAGRRRPAREVERGGVHAVAERAEHRVGERALVPGAVVAAAVDEERRRHAHAARARARRRPRRRAPGPRAAVGGVAGARGPRSRTTAREVVLGERLRAGHQLDVRAPERVLVRGGLRELGGAPREVAAGDRPVPEHVAQAVAEAVAQLRDLLVRRAAVRAGVAAVLDERQVRAGRAEDVVAARVHGAVQPVCECAFGRRHGLTSAGCRAARDEVGALARSRSAPSHLRSGAPGFNVEEGGRVEVRGRAAARGAPGRRWDAPRRPCPGPGHAARVPVTDVPAFRPGVPNDRSSARQSSDACAQLLSIGGSFRRHIDYRARARGSSPAGAARARGRRPHAPEDERS